MAILLDYSFYGYDYFDDNLATVRDIQYAELNAAIVDEFMVRENVEPMINVKDTWDNDMRILAKFQNTLEAGNVYNNGVKIVSFKIKRKLATDLNSLDISTVTFNATGNYDYFDTTQPNGNLIYTIVPIGENGLDGTPVDANVLSQFSGTWLVDKNTNNVLAFDKVFNLGTIDSTYNKNRTVLEGFSKYPQVYYGQTGYESFTLTTVIVPDTGNTSSVNYVDIVKNFIDDFEPKLLKMDNGKMLVVDVGNMKTSTPTFTWDGNDYFQVSVDVTEIDSYENYLKG